MHNATGQPGSRGTLFARRPTRGVTLIELLVTLSVVAILLAIGVPSFQAVLARNRIAGITNDLMGALNLTRSEAIKRGKIVTICKSTNTDATDNSAASTPTPTCSTSSTVGWQDGWLIFVDDSSAMGAQRGVRNTGEQLLRVHQPSTDNATINGAPNFPDFLSYLPSGVSKASSLANGAFAISSASEQRCIQVSTTGRARLMQGACP